MRRKRALSREDRLEMAAFQKVMQRAAGEGRRDLTKEEMLTELGNELGSAAAERFLGKVNDALLARQRFEEKHYSLEEARERLSKGLPEKLTLEETQKILDAARCKPIIFEVDRSLIN